ncbi:MAG: succinate dehydrogenase [Gammaproteobacteria bacterium]|nr:succinate dehydrogenase [Gammaproteobacteria bacterium]MCY4219974.1 succinate dehydrogenase [Gammaproteobacteria bacterium]MCY4275402.1 succinate dehydrogenase [Gammaproteobacteria bacterium]
MNEQTLFVVQRISAAILIPFVLVHLGLILVAVEGGLSANEILSRTHGNFIWLLFYGLFVVAAAIHAPIGIRNILREWTKLDWRMINGLAMVLCAILLILGMSAVIAVF